MNLLNSKKTLKKINNFWKKKSNLIIWQNKPKKILQGKNFSDNVLIFTLDSSRGSSILYNLEIILSILPSTTFDFMLNAIAKIAAAVYSPIPGSESKTSLLLGTKPL